MFSVLVEYTFVSVSYKCDNNRENEVCDHRVFVDLVVQKCFVEIFNTSN